MKRKKSESSKSIPKLEESQDDLISIRKEVSEYVKKVAQVENNNHNLKLKNETLSKENDELKLEVKSLKEQLELEREENETKLKIAKEQWAKRAVHYAKEYKKNVRERGGSNIEPPIESVVKDCRIM